MPESVAMGREIREIRSSCGQVEASTLGARERAKTLYCARGGSVHQGSTCPVSTLRNGSSYVNSVISMRCSIMSKRAAFVCDPFAGGWL